MHHRRCEARAALVFALALAGGAAAGAACVPPPAETFAPVGAEVQRRLGAPARWRAVDDAEADARVAAAVTARLAEPLDRDAVVRIAIAQNRHLQADYERLGVAAAAVAAATVLRPTEVDLNVKYARGGGETELAAVQDVLDLIQLGARRGAAGAELLAARRRATAATVELAARAELAFYDAVAAGEVVALRQTAFDAADASATLVARQHDAHNVSDLALVREEAQREDARVALGRARADAEVAREALGAAMGLPAGPAWRVVAALPEPPATAPAEDDLERAAIDASLELAALRDDADAAAARGRIAGVRAWLPELAVGAAAARRDGGEWEVGPAVRLGLPLFDRQDGPRAAAAAARRRAEDEGAATAVDVAARARAARARVAAGFDEVHHLAVDVLPLRQRVLDETLLQYNAMNASTFELLAARRDQVEAAAAYVDALRRYWRAVAEAAALRAGAAPTSPTTPTATTTTTTMEALP